MFFTLNINAIKTSIIRIVLKASILLLFVKVNAQPGDTVRSNGSYVNYLKCSSRPANYTGQCAEYRSNGTLLSISNYINGDLEGAQIAFGNNGLDTIRITTYKDDIPNGYYYANGKDDHPYVTWMSDNSDERFELDDCYEPLSLGKGRSSIKYICEGYYKNGQRDSSWTFWTLDGKKLAEGSYFSLWKKNNKNKYYKIIDDQWNYKCGRKLGKWTTWYDNGNIESICTYDSSNQRTGSYQSWYWNGNKKEEGIYTPKNHSEYRTGSWTYWYSNGQKRLEVDYTKPFEAAYPYHLDKFKTTADKVINYWERNGEQTVIDGDGVINNVLKLCGTNDDDSTIYKSSTCKDEYLQIEHYKNGLADSTWEYWAYPDGIASGKRYLSAVYNYKDGLANGSFTYYNTNGSVNFTDNYKNGVRQGETNNPLVDQYKKEAENKKKRERNEKKWRSAPDLVIGGGGIIKKATYCELGIAWTYFDYYDTEIKSLSEEFVFLKQDLILGTKLNYTRQIGDGFVNSVGINAILYTNSIYNMMYLRPQLGAAFLPASLGIVSCGANIPVTKEYEAIKNNIPTVIISIVIYPITTVAFFKELLGSN